MRLVDVRRLTGPNLLASTPLVIVEVALEGAEDVQAALCAYRGELGRMREALGLPRDVELRVRPHRGGAVFAYQAPIDVMLACTDMSEWAVESAAEVLAGRVALELEPRREEIAAALAGERSPRLLALVAEAAQRGVPLLWDDAIVSLGMGRRSVSFLRAEIPDAADVAWGELGEIPVVLITGTNGKTTSSRLLGRVAAEAGLRVGATSTGGVTVGSSVVEEGDWTGPAAARLVLRRPDVELAVLETARGGILRRGLAVDACDAALITNVSDDHIGLGGIDDVDAMTQLKGVVAHAVRPGGTVALNASDPHLVGLARELACEVTFFADLEGGAATGDRGASDAAPAGRAAARAVIEQHRARGGRAVFTQGGAIVTARGTGARAEEALVRVDAVPITFGGAARYNVENVLGVVAVAEALGLARDAIARGIAAFAMRDNPGRGQIVRCGGVTVLVDFGHNPEGVRAVMQLVTALRRGASGGARGKLTIVAGSAGDRSDQEIADLARVLYEARPDSVFVRELVDYVRGRELGEVPALYRRFLRELGMPEEAFAIVASEVDALARAFDGAEDGDFIVLLVHLDEAEVQAFLAPRADP